MGFSSFFFYIFSRPQSLLYHLLVVHSHLCPNSVDRSSIQLIYIEYPFSSSHMEGYIRKIQSRGALTHVSYDAVRPCLCRDRGVGVPGTQESTTRPVLGMVGRGEQGVGEGASVGRTDIIWKRLQMHSVCTQCSLTITPEASSW